VVVADLLDEGLVEEVGQGERVIGKPPTMLSIERNGRNILNLDLSFDGFRGCVLNLRGEVIHELRFPLEGRRGPRALNLAKRIVDTLDSATSRPILGLGVGTPGLVDSERGLIREAVSLEWVDVPLAQILAEGLDVPVYVANDSSRAWPNAASATNMVVLIIW